MKRRAALAALAAVFALPARGQKPARTPRIGMLILASAASVAGALESFRASLRELGYVEGRNIQFEVFSAEGNSERLAALAAQLVARKVDIIVTGGGNVSTLAARNATATIPIVMSTSFAAVEAGLVKSLARPGGNVTGLSAPQELGIKTVQLLQELVPSLSRVVVLVRGDPAMEPFRKQARDATQQMLLVTLEFVEVRGPDDLERALGVARAARPQAMIVAPDPLLFQLREPILRFARQARRPARRAAEQAGAGHQCEGGQVAWPRDSAGRAFAVRPGGRVA